MIDTENNINPDDGQVPEIPFKHVDGEQKGIIDLYALSTCGWCKKTRMFLEEHDIAYNYIYVDLTSGEERDVVVGELEKYNPDLSFPTIVINNTGVIVGYKPEELAATLDIPNVE
ncbi:glutaredoxin family protein [uncultured Methanobrevibacter sp.]|uniref:glutaredoxin family protein n=1 Tax=uncultured Methanobrevibacter sp. TaxID=253161 RepID=UPI0026DF467A|nr:glutaredoxin family protein [uncultured Methanobrevibacter sp.]